MSSISTLLEVTYAELTESTAHRCHNGRKHRNKLLL